MKDEIFDVVDERDAVIGQRPRSEVHRLGLRHRAVHILVFNRHGQMFLQKRSMKKDMDPGRWDSSAAGHLSAGEDYDAAALRELREELGLSLAVCPERLGKIVACEETTQEHVWVYRLNAEGPFRLDPEEIDTGGWFEREKIEQWLAERPEDFTSALRLIWGRFSARFPI